MGGAGYPEQGMKLGNLLILVGTVWVAPHTSPSYALCVGLVFVVAGLVLAFVDASKGSCP